jgi:transcriptional regulator with XRE-family HTH domain
MNKLGNYLNMSFLKWQLQMGKKKTQEEFATYLEISRPLLTMWINGDRRPGRARWKRLAELLDDEIYDALDEPKPDPDLVYLQAHWVGLPSEIRKAMRETAEKYEVKEIANAEK